MLDRHFSDLRAANLTGQHPRQCGCPTCPRWPASIPRSTPRSPGRLHLRPAHPLYESSASAGFKTSHRRRPGRQMLGLASARSTASPFTWETVSIPRSNAPFDRHVDGADPGELGDERGPETSIRRLSTLPTAAAISSLTSSATSSRAWGSAAGRAAQLTLELSREERRAAIDVFYRSKNTSRRTRRVLCRLDAVVHQHGENAVPVTPRPGNLTVWEYHRSRLSEQMAGARKNNQFAAERTAVWSSPPTKRDWTTPTRS